MTIQEGALNVSPATGLRRVRAPLTLTVLHSDHQQRHLQYNEYTANQKNKCSRIDMQTYAGSSQPS